MLFDLIIVIIPLGIVLILALLFPVLFPDGPELQPFEPRYNFDTVTQIAGAEKTCYCARMITAAETRDSASCQLRPNYTDGQLSQVYNTNEKCTCFGYLDVVCNPVPDSNPEVTVNLTTATRSNIPDFSSCDNIVNQPSSSSEDMYCVQNSGSYACTGYTGKQQYTEVGPKLEDRDSNNQLLSVSCAITEHTIPCNHDVPCV